jgi:hypothetical protein
MGNFFGKPLDQIDRDDILSLIDTPEGQLFEIKSELPAEKRSKDPWYTTPELGETRKGPGDYAKQNIFKEIVAFANSEGGWLVLGLTETSDHPKRVKGLAPLPDCHELAERFKRAAYDWIDPPFPSLQCRAIDMEDSPEKGVIIFRVPRSLAGPHRLYKKDRTQESYKRVNDESKPMKMREIQDLTLDITMGHERIDREFKNARERHLLLKPQHSSKSISTGFYIALVPISGPIVIDRPYMKTNLFDRRQIIKGNFVRQKQELDIDTIDAKMHSRSISGVQPILRGGKKNWSSTYYTNEQPQEDLITVEIFDSGIIQLSVKTTFDGLSLRWILADLANALCITEVTRIVGGIPDAEYAMEVELSSYKAVQGNLIEKEFQLGLLHEDDLQFSRKIGPDPLLLPRYLIGSRDNFPKIIKLVMDDLYNALGRSHMDDFEFTALCQ